jgi:16S rRNA processing protein RimM
MKERPEFVAIGNVARAHGIKGEVQVNPLTDELQQFKTLQQVYLRSNKGERELLKVERARVQNDKVILKFEGIDNRTDAADLKDSRIEKQFDPDVPLLPDEYYIFDLIGLVVKTTENRLLGEITEVLTLPANDVYVVQNGAKEYLVPAIKDVIKQVDLDAGTLLIQPIDGLL